MTPAANAAISPSHVVVLTGGLAMGKSTVAKAFIDAGFCHWDADATVHDIYHNGHYNGVVALLREVIPEAIPYDDSGTEWPIKMSVVRRAVTHDPSLLPQIEAIIGPRLVNHLYGFMRIFFDVPAYLVDTPLYFEDRASGIRKTVEAAIAERGGNLATIVVSCPPDMQLERAMLRPGMTPEKFNLLTSKQMSDAKKRELADYVIDTSSSPADTQSQVENIMVALRLGGFF